MTGDRSRGAVRARPSGTSPAASTRRCGRCAPSGASSRCSWPRARARPSPTPTATATSTWSARGAPMIVGHAHPAVVDGRARGDGPRLVVRRADAGRERPRRGASKHVYAADRAAALRVERHRGVDERRSASRAARTGREKVAEVRRLLPRPRRRAAGRGRLGPRDARHPVVAGRAARPSPPARSWCPSTTTTRSTARSRRTAPTWPARSSRACAGNMGVVPPARGFLERLQERCRDGAARASSSTR